MDKVKRVNLSGVYNTRPTPIKLSGSSGIFGIGIWGNFIWGQVAQGSDKDHRLINCLQITETDEVNRTKRLYVVKRPGLEAAFTPRAGHIGNAIHIWGGQGTGQKVMSCFGNSNSNLYDSAAYRGMMTGKATGISETSISDVPTLTISSSDNTGWVYQEGVSAALLTESGNTLITENSNHIIDETSLVSKIVDANFPGNLGKTLAGTFAHMDGYTFIMDSLCDIYNSDLNAMSWTAGAKIRANAIPDVGVAAVRNRNQIIGFCKEHFDVFINGQTPTGSILTRVAENSQLYGAISADAIAVLKDTIYFAGTTKGANIAIYAYGGGQVQPVSTPEIDLQLSLAGPSNISVTTLGFYGRHFIVVTAASSTFVYCIEENNWEEWNAAVPLWYKADGVSFGSTLVDYVISKNSTDGKVYVINPLSITYQDDGVSFSAILQTAEVDFGSIRRKSWKRIDVIGDQEPGSTLNISWFDDDYQNVSASREVDMSVSRPSLTGCGSSNARAFVVTHSVNTPMRLQALEVTFSEGR